MAHSFFTWATRHASTPGPSVITRSTSTGLVSLADTHAILESMAISSWWAPHAMPVARHLSHQLVGCVTVLMDHASSLSDDKSQLSRQSCRHGCAAVMRNGVRREGGERGWQWREDQMRGGPPRCACPVIVGCTYDSSSSGFSESMNSTCVNGKCPTRPFSSPSHWPLIFVFVTVMMSPTSNLRAVLS